MPDRVGPAAARGACRGTRPAAVRSPCSGNSALLALIRTTAYWIDRAARLVSAGLVLVILGVMSAQVVWRYGLNSSLPWSEELSIWAMIWMVFVGSAIVMRGWGHIFIPSVVRLFPLPLRAGLIVLSKLLVLVFLGLLMFYGWSVFSGPANAFSHGVGLSTKWAKLAVPAGAFLMALTVLADIAEDLAAILSRQFGRFARYGELDAPDRA